MTTATQPAGDVAPAGRTEPGGGRWRLDLLILFGCALMVTVPFAGRVFHTDDHETLELAKAILERPARPFDGQESVLDIDVQVFEHVGKRPRIFERLSNPPLFAYLFAAAAHLAGQANERVYHAVCLPFVLAAVCAAYALGRRFTAYPLCAALLTLASPMFLLTAHSVLRDIILLAFYLTAVALYVYGTDQDRRGLLMLAGVCAGLAILTRYIAFSLIPLLAAYALLSTRRLRARSLLPLVVALAMYGGWEMVNVRQYGSMHLRANSAFFTAFYADILLAPPVMFTNLLAYLSYLGGATVFPLLLWRTLLGGRARLAVLTASLVLAAFARWGTATAPLAPYTAGKLFLLLLFFSSGLLVAWHVLHVGAVSLRALVRTWRAGVDRQAADRAFLCCWFAGMLLALILLLPFATARYLLPLLVPAVLLIVPAAAARFPAGPGRALIAAGVVPTLLAGLVLAYADYRFAALYKEFAASAAVRYPLENRRLWFIGDGGFRYYMEQHGHAYLWHDSQPADGDLVVVAQQVAYHEMSDRVKSRVRFLGRFPVHDRLPVRVLNSMARAGFHESGSGLLPYSFSRAPLEIFDVFVVKAPSFFVENFSNATIGTEEKEQVGFSLWDLDGDIRSVLLEHPPFKITYRLTVPEGALLYFAVAMHPGVWDPALGDGVTFEISASYEGGEETLFSEYIDPKHNVDDRKWHDARVDLSGYAGKEILLNLITLPGPADNADYDLAGWGDLELVVL